ncbi:fimbrial protein, partial [Vibrio breoganii]
MDTKSLSSIETFLRDEEGLTIIEYVLGAALMVAILGVVFSALEGRLKSSLENTIDSVG